MTKKTVTSKILPEDKKDNVAEGQANIDKIYKKNRDMLRKSLDNLAISKIQPDLTNDAIRILNFIYKANCDNKGVSIQGVFHKFNHLLPNETLAILRTFYASGVLHGNFSTMENLKRVKISVNFFKAAFLLYEYPIRRELQLSPLMIVDITKDIKTKKMAFILKLQEDRTAIDFIIDAIRHEVWAAMRIHTMKKNEVTRKYASYRSYRKVDELCKAMVFMERIKSELCRTSLILEGKKYIPLFKLAADALEIPPLADASTACTDLIENTIITGTRKKNPKNTFVGRGFNWNKEKVSK